MSSEHSAALYQRAAAVLPGGVNSPVRAFGAVGGDPIFVAHGSGPFIFDADGRRYIDYVCSWGPLILGHAPPTVVEAVHRAASQGTSFGFPTQMEVALAELVTQLVPSMQKVRFVNSGTEATMSAIRVARGYSSRDRIIKFSGCYHGHADAFLADAGSGVATLGIPGSAGVPIGAVRDSFTVPYNDLAAVEKVIAKHGDEIAAIIVEPVACNMGLVVPQPGFLTGLRKLCDACGALLVFDEVITGFRLGPGGAQQYFDVQPDLTTLGKIIGGGLPVGAYGGRADVMGIVAPEGSVYQAGTLSGNPLAMAAGLATLNAIRAPHFFEQLDGLTQSLTNGLAEVFRAHDNVARVDRLGSIFYLWFKPRQDAGPRNYAEVKTADSARFGRFFRRLLTEGVAIAPSGFEVGFVSAAHTPEQIDATVRAVDRALSAMKTDG